MLGFFVREPKVPEDVPGERRDPNRVLSLGHSADRVFDCGLATASDDAMRAYAAKIGAVIVTKDEDFVEDTDSGSGSRLTMTRV